MKIGYFLWSYPVFSETFAINEIYQLQQCGIEGCIWYEVEADVSTIHPIVRKIKFPKYSIPYKILRREFFWKILMGHVFWIICEPSRYFKSLFTFFSFFSVDNFKIFLKAPLVAWQVRQSGCTILYVHESDRAFLFALLCKILCNIPLGIILYTYYLFVKTRYLGQKVALSDFVILQSEYSKKVLLKKLGGKMPHPKNVFVIPSPGVVVSFFRPLRPRTYKKKILIISIGRLVVSKGFDRLIQAIAILKNRGLTIHCTIVGYGPQRKRLESLVKAHNLSRQVSFKGRVAQTRRYIHLMSNVEIFVLCSIMDKTGDRDMQPTAVKEAMAMKLLVITTKLGGIEEVIQDRVNGFLLRSAAPRFVADVILKVFSLPASEKKRVAKAARQTIVDYFDSRKITDQLIGVFNAHNANG